MGCCGSSDDDVLLIGNRRKSRCLQGTICGIGILALVAGITVLVLFVFKGKDGPSSSTDCSMKFDHLEAFEDNYGTFLSTYFIERCTEERPKVNGTHPPHWHSNLPPPPNPSQSTCSAVKKNQKFDCYPRGNLTKEECVKRGCCYGSGADPTIPSCFYPADFAPYSLLNRSEDDFGIMADYKANFDSPYPDTAVNFTLKVRYLSQSHFAIHIVRGDRTEKLDPLLPQLLPPKHPVNPTERQYRVEISPGAFGFKVVRASNNATMFETTGGLIVSGQVLQISALTPKVLFGIGERRGSIRLDTSIWSTITLFNHDSAPTTGWNGYGTLPFYLAIEEDGMSHGVSFLNYHGMDVDVQPAPGLTFRTIGGAVSFLFTMGNNPADVVALNTAIVSPKPQFPPYWALGFHLCRFGFKNTDDIIKVWNRTRAAGIPYDTQWADIDYMKTRNDFTVDPINFKGLKDFVDHLHSVDMKFVPILDPGVAGSEPAGTYPPYDDGVRHEIFIMDNDKPYRGLVWNPKSTVFVDFSNPKSLQYWTSMLKDLHTQLPFDGMWIDMNEPSNFNYNGSECAVNSLNNPPFVPAVKGNVLSYQTVCMSAQHFAGHHYTFHNVYATLEAAVTSLGVTEAIGGKRPFVVSRASFLTSPTYTAHWTGDVYSSWDDLVQSIRDIQSQALFGQGMIGADICGFNQNTTVPLCARWTAAGAFYPFSRNHNSDENIDQDPVALGPDVINAAKVSLTMRYSLLPYLYTLLYLHHVSHAPVIHPMFMEFPKDNQTYSIEDQFMWGTALLFAPILTDVSTNSRRVYLGPGKWLDWYTGTETNVTGDRGQYVTASASSGAVPAFIRGGNVIPMQHPNTTTAQSRKNNFMLRGALDDKGEAAGSVYWDDGESLKMNKEYNVVAFAVANNTLVVRPLEWKYQTTMILDSVKLAPLPTVHSVTVNSQNVTFQYTPNIKELVVSNFTAPMGSLITIKWTV